MYTMQGAKDSDNLLVYWVTTEPDWNGDFAPVPVHDIILFSDDSTGGGGGGGTGDVTGPSGATDNAVTRFNGTSGNLIQNSLVIIDDSGNITTPGTVDGVDISTIPSTYALQSTTISAGNGLIGGGSLAANRTISLQPGLLDGYLSSSILDGYVRGPASASDNAIARYDLTTGKLIQDSGITISDAGNISTNTNNSLTISTSGDYASAGNLIVSAGSGSSNGGNLGLLGGFGGSDGGDVTIEGGGSGNTAGNVSISGGSGSVGGNVSIQSGFGITPGSVNITSGNTNLTSSGITEIYAEGNLGAVFGVNTNFSGATTGQVLAKGVSDQLEYISLPEFPSLDGYATTSYVNAQDNIIKSALDGYALSSTVTSLTNNLQSQINTIEDTIDGYIEGITVRRNTGADIGTQPRLNFIEGSNITLSISNDPGSSELDITISSSGGGGGGGVGSLFQTLAVGNSTDGYDVNFTDGSNIVTDTELAIQVNGTNAAIFGADTDFDAASVGQVLSKNSNNQLEYISLPVLPSLDGYATITYVDNKDNVLQSQINFIEDTLDGYATTSYVNTQDNTIRTALDGYALRTRNINTGTGLTGGGNLTADRTISIQPGFLDGYARNTSLDGYVPTSRTITAGAGLTGGGNLTANRTISLQAGLLDGYALSSTVTSLTNNLQSQINFVEDTLDGYVLSSRQIIAGTGLSGGGNLTANRTISLQQGLLDGYARNSSLDGYISGIVVRENSGSNIGTRPRLNFIEGSNISMTITDDPANNEIDITINSSGSGGGSTDGYVFQTRQINTGSGLVGGGDLSANRTISLQPGLLDGYVTGPSSAADNAIARFDLTTGKLIQNSSVTIDDNNNLNFGNITTNSFVRTISTTTQTTAGFSGNGLTISSGAGRTSGVSGAVTLLSSDGYSAGVVDGNTGVVVVRSGNIDAGGTGATGNISLRSGANSGSGASGTVTLQSGNTVSVTSGSATVTTGNNTSTGSSGAVTLSTGTTVSGTSGLVFISSGAPASGQSGIVSIRTGITSDNTSGSMNINTGNNTGTGNTGSTNIATGTVNNGATGAININTGAATTGTSGNIGISTGAGTGTTGNVSISTGVSSAGTAGSINIIPGTGITGGSVTIRPSTGSSTTGVLQLQNAASQNAIRINNTCNFDSAATNSILTKVDSFSVGYQTIGQIVGSTLDGYVRGPASSTDNAIVRFDGTTGKLIQDGYNYISDTGNIFLTGSTRNIQTENQASSNTNALSLNIGTGTGNGTGAGGLLTMLAGGGGTTGNGGSAQIAGGSGGSLSGAGGAIIIAGGAGRSAAGGAVTIQSGVVQTGTAAAGAVNITVNNSRSTDAPALTLQGGGIAAGSGMGGNIVLNPGAGSGAADGYAVVNGELRFDVAGYNAWPTIINTDGYEVIDFDLYQAATLQYTEDCTVSLDTPRAPGAFKLLVVPDGYATLDIISVLPIYAPDGAIDVPSTDRTLIGLVYDGNAWTIVSSTALQLVT